MRLLIWAVCLLFPVATIAQEQVTVGTGAVLRALEKVSGNIQDFPLNNGEQASFGRLTIELSQCRYPEGDLAADAFAFLTIRETGKDDPAFSGWMVASAPALNALDHPRYDVWVMRCKTE